MLAFLDFLLAWDIGTIIIAAAVLMVVVLVASYGIAVAWRRWKEGKRMRAARAKGLGPVVPPAPRTGVRFSARAIVTKLPGRGAPKEPTATAPAEPPAKRSLPKFGRKTK